MTPFDPIALLAMLRAFYPDANATNFARASVERPEYFAGGSIEGSHGDKLLVPDGRVFDYIFDVDGPDHRWQAIDVSDPAGDLDISWRLAPGPLTPIAASTWRRPPAAPVFMPIVTAALGDLGDADVWLDRAHADLAAASSPAAFLADMNPSFDLGLRTRTEQYDLAGLSVPDDVFDAMNGAHAELDAHESELPTSFPDPFGDTWISDPPTGDDPPPGSEIDIPPIWGL